tara:strand:- start:740 stop:916 length:177 start_codon:yes stop_codon:yes gene_type:complete
MLEMNNPILPNLVLDVMGPTKNAVEGIEAIMRVFKVDEKTATELLDNAIKVATGNNGE